MDYMWILYAIIGIAVIIVFGGIFFSKIKFTKNSIELNKENGHSEATIITLKQKIEKVDDVVRLVESNTFDATVKYSTVKLQDIINAQVRIAEDQLVPLREKFMETLDYLSRDESEHIFFLNLVTIYFNIVVKNLKVSFEENNWKEMTMQEFGEMIQRKINILLSEWKGVVGVYYPVKKAATAKNIVMDIIEDKHNYVLNEIFRDTMHTIFTMARRRKTIAESKMEKIKKDMENYNISIYQTNLPPAKEK